MKKNKARRTTRRACPKDVDEQELPTALETDERQHRHPEIVAETQAQIAEAQRWQRRQQLGQTIRSVHSSARAHQHKWLLEVPLLSEQCIHRYGADSHPAVLRLNPGWKN